MGELNFCTIHDILKTAWEQVISDLSLDLSFPYVVSRLLHNKIFSLSFFSLRCYLLYFDLSQLATFVPRLLIPFIGYAFVEKRLRRLLWTIQAFFPFVFILNIKAASLGTRITLFSAYYTLVGIVGVLKLLTKKAVTGLL